MASSRVPSRSGTPPRSMACRAPRSALNAVTTSMHGKGRHRVCNGGLVLRVRYASGTVSRPPLGGLVGFIQTRPSDYETTGPPSTREAGQARQPGPHTGQRRPLRSATGRWARLTELTWTGGHVEARRRICHGRTDQEAKAAIALLDRFARKRIEKNSASDGGIARCRTTNVVDE